MNIHVAPVCCFFGIKVVAESLTCAGFPCMHTFIHSYCSPVVVIPGDFLAPKH